MTLLPKKREARTSTGGIMNLKVKAVTFDDWLTLRHSVGEREDIIHPILDALKERGLEFDDREFLKQYFRADGEYRRTLEETLRESTLDDIVSSVLTACGCEPEEIGRAVKEAVDRGLKTREYRWFPDAKRTLRTLRERGYGLGLISNTHWRILKDLREEFEELFDVVTLSYEHGHAKPHPSIFLATLNRVGVDPDDCLHVGDDPIADIQGARGVGMKTAFIERGRMETAADITICRLDELLKYLQKR
jgi:HAD superfamily hydrolase (TIGR01549 family)